MPSTAPPNNTTSKHRACDECRSRKLACSKEPNGCSRCVREGMRCHYSEQKPMGRPRKRQANGNPKDHPVELHPVLPEFDALPCFDQNFPIDPYIDASGLPFTNNTVDQPIAFPEQPQAKGLCTLDDGRVVFHFGDEEFNNPIDFGTDDTNSEELFGTIVSTASSVSPTQDPVVEPRISYHMFSSNKPHDSSPGPPCSCLATMYLAMSSLQEFPSVVETALATVRAAANAAQQSMRCEKCGTPLAVSLHPSIEAFQNTMLLGTILPLIANGYKRLLIMVDQEAELAQKAGIRKMFSMAAYGGLHGVDLCNSGNHLEGAVMESMEWRAAVRGLLRADVYGIENKFLGLKGIISEMEVRQRLRHSQIDELIANGVPQHEIEGRQCSGEKDMLCMRILDTAKLAVDSLVIP